MPIRLPRGSFPKPSRLDALAPFPAGEALAGMYEMMKGHNPETAAHCGRVAAEAGRISKEMALSGRFQAVAFLAGLFHDIGKTAVSEKIIRKKGLLTGEEFEAVKLHTEKTREMLEKICWPRSLCRVPDAAASHHEWWNGSGYPRGLAGEDIPLGARIVAVADAFDALTHRRRYREPMAPDDAGVLLAAKSGSHFDPAVIEAFRRRFAPVPDDASSTRKDTCAARLRFPEVLRRCHDSELRRCR